MTRRLPFAVAVMLGAAVALVSGQAMSPWQDVIRNLRHPKAETRLAAVDKLEAAGYAPAAEPVAALLVDPDERVQEAAIEAELTFFLTARLSDSHVLGIGSSESRAQQAFEEGPLIRVATAAPPVLVDKLIAAMRAENARVRFDAVHALGFIAEAPLTPDQVTALADGLDHYDPVMRMATARVIGRLHAAGAGDKLLVALGDSNASVREYAAEALGLVREPRALVPLRELVARGGEPASYAILALARIGSADDLTLFRQRLTDRDPSMRRAAAEGLGRLRDRDSITALDGVLKADPAAGVRLAAAFALELLGESQSQTVAAMLDVKDVGGEARDDLFEIGHDAIPGLVAVLRVATESKVRADLVQAIGYVGQPDDATILDPLLKDPDQRVVIAVTAAITRLRR